MTKKKSPTQRDALFTLTRNTIGRHSRMLDEAITAAQNSGRLDETDGGIISLARANAAALDDAETDRKYYAIAQLTGPYKEVLDALRMTPQTREEELSDDLNRALRELSQAEVRHP